MVLLKIRGSSFLLPSRIIPIVRYSFSYLCGVCQKLFSCFFSPEAIIPVIVLYLSRCFIQVFLNQLEFFPVIRSLFFVHFQFLQWFVQRVLLLGYHINSFVLSKSYRRIVEDFSQVYAISLLILSTRISSMPNPLLVINLNW